MYSEPEPTGIKSYGLVFVGLALVLITAVYYRVYLPYKLTEEGKKYGFVIVKSEECPVSHPIKANYQKMTYQNVDAYFYKSTNASEGYCFDTEDDAQAAGYTERYVSPETVATIEKLAE